MLGHSLEQDRGCSLMSTTALLSKRVFSFGITLLEVLKLTARTAAV